MKSTDRPFIGRSRRREPARQGWAGFARARSAVVGLATLGVVAALALLAPVLSDPGELDVTEARGGLLKPPSAQYPLGTDEYGRSVLLLVWWGARVSLLVGLLATLLAVGIGTLVGLLAGHFRGWVGSCLMRITDFFLVLPSLVLAIALSTVLPRGMGTIVLAIALTSWPTTARLVRSQTLNIEARPYVERARALGGGHRHVLGRHVLPAVIPLVLANTTLTVASAIITESTLSFLGLGDPTAVSWGSTLKSGLDAGAATASAWWYLVPPGLGIVLIVLTVTLVGRALEAMVNPRLRTP